MAVLDHDEQEKVDELRAFWNTWGNRIIWALALVLAIVAGYYGWEFYQRRQSEEASAVFFTLQKATADKDLGKVRQLAGELIEHYGRTDYAVLGAFYSARAHADAKDWKSAKAVLGWAVEHAADRGLGNLARLRLAYVLVEEGALDEALKQLASEPEPAYASRFLDARGDILMMQNKPKEARAAFEAALAKLDSQSAESAQIREIIKFKLDSLDGAS